MLDNIVNSGKRLLVGITALATLGGCATTATYDVDQFCGTNPIENGTLVKDVANVDDRGIKNVYVRIEKGSEKFVKMNYDGDNIFEEQLYSVDHNDGSRTEVRCFNDGVFEPFGGKWKMHRTEYDANRNLVEEEYQPPLGKVIVKEDYQTAR